MKVSPASFPAHSGQTAARFMVSLRMESYKSSEIGSPVGRMAIGRPR